MLLLVDMWHCQGRQLHQAHPTEKLVGNRRLAAPAPLSRHALATGVAGEFPSPLPSSLSPLFIPLEPFTLPSSLIPLESYSPRVLFPSSAPLARSDCFVVATNFVINFVVATSFVISSIAATSFIIAISFVVATSFVIVIAVAVIAAWGCSGTCD